MRKLIFWLILYTALLGGSYMLYSLVLPIRISFHIAALVVLFIYLYKRGLPDSPLTLGAGLILTAVLFAIPSAIDPRMALENGWSWLINLLIFLALIQLCREGYAPTLFKAHFVAGALVAVFAIGEFMLIHTRPAGLFDNINLTGAYLAALFIPALNAYLESEPFKGNAYLYLCGAILVALVIGENRGAILSAGVATLAYITLVWQKHNLAKLALWTWGAVALLGVFMALTLIRGGIWAESARLDLWRAAHIMIQQYPTGTGPGLFAQAYRYIGLSGLNRFTGAHNTYLNIGAELGAPGLAAGAALLLLFGYALSKVSLNGSQRAALASLIGIAAHMLVDNYPSVNWAMMIALYAAYVVYEVKLIPPRRLLRLASTGAALLLIVWTSQMIQFDRAQISYEAALNTRRYMDAYEATELDPDNALYGIELARLAGQDLSHLDTDMPMYALTMYGRRFK